MRRIPVLIDGARVLRVADISALVPTGRTRHIVFGAFVDRFDRLAIARYDGADGFYLFYCDAEWNCITDTYHDDVASAIRQAEFEYGAVSFVDSAAER
ncbi:hypothetical protein ACFC06_20295 [Nocardia sp. NPDC056064]|uniref:hypothetical protein n=1 Tax=Nocardia sp. NPDC056064 TaxID=3345701 RepID=UPI0035E1B46A